MLFLLYLIIPVGIFNLILALFFPFPAPLIGVSLQAAFFLISLFVFISRMSKKKGILRSIIATGIHGAILVFIINLYVHAVIPNQEKDEYKVFKTSTVGVMKSLLKKITGDDSSVDNGRVDQTESSETSSGNVEDPF